MAHPSPDPWRGFHGDAWRADDVTVDVDAFVRDNVAPHAGGTAFLAGATPRTAKIWRRLLRMFEEERRRGVHDVDAHTPSSITSHAPGYLDQGHELIVGLQTSAPLKRAIMPAGGLRAVQAALASYGYGLDSTVRTIYSQYRRTHGDAVADAYPEAVRRAGRAHLITGLEGVCGRSRISGDYRRVALYGVDRLVAERARHRAALDTQPSSERVVRQREELAEQIRALEDLRYLAARYGRDIAGPAATGQEAVQWLYFAYLAAAKEHYGATLDLGGTAPFVDVFLQRDLAEGRLTEEQAQELVDDFVIKLRIIRYLPDAPAPLPLTTVEPPTRTALRYRQAQRHLGAAPTSRATADGIRADLAKALLYAINGGRDEVSGEQVAPASVPVGRDVLDHDEVLAAYDRVLDWVAATYRDALAVNDHLQDRYAYERLEAALCDFPERRELGFGTVGLTAAANSLSAIRHAQVKVLRDATGLVVDYVVDGDFPAADGEAVAGLAERFRSKLRRCAELPPPAGAHGRHTGSTPDGRRAAAPYPPSSLSGGFPMSALEQAAHAAQYAPSVFNTQPWQWRIAGDTMELHADTGRRLEVVDRDGRLQLLSCGAALHHARVALAAAGHAVTVERVPDPARPALLARITLAGPAPADPEARRLAAAVPQRRTDRRAFTGREVAEEELTALRRLVEAEGAYLHVVPPDQVGQLAVAAERAGSAEAGDPAYRAELQRWTTRPGFTGDGVPRSTAVRPEPRRVPVRDFAPGSTAGLGAGEEHDQGAAFVVLFGTADRVVDLLRGGEALSALLLRATADGLATAPLTDAVEVEWPRHLVAGLLAGVGEPYAVVRLGYRPDGEPLPPVPRRDPRDVITIIE